MQALFQTDFTGVELNSAIDFLLTDTKLGEKELDFVEHIAYGTIENLPAIDAELKEYLIEWSINRLPRVDRSILRIAFYELIYEPATSYKVVVNEAIEIAKEYGGDESASYINGVLASYINKQNGETEA
jgi:N utilization substance protein B